MRVRFAYLEDHAELIRVLARAFDDDPIQRWVFPGARICARNGGEFFRWSLWRRADQHVSFHWFCPCVDTRQGLWDEAESHFARAASIGASDDKEYNAMYRALEVVRHVARGEPQAALEVGGPCWKAL